MRYYGDQQVRRLALVRMAEWQLLAARPLPGAHWRGRVIGWSSRFAGRILRQAGSRLVSVGERLEGFALGIPSAAG
jgi:hypothetical protein